jgi:hypothetical protein
MNETSLAAFVDLYWEELLYQCAFLLGLGLIVISR